MCNAKRVIFVLLCLLITGLPLFTGCGSSSDDVPEIAQNPMIAKTGQRLVVTGTHTEDTKRKEYSQSEGERGVHVNGLDDTRIIVDGAEMLLQEAVEQGRITPEEIATYARLDALGGYCGMTAESVRGLTTFYYVYQNQFKVRVVDDIYETPDGKQHHIQTVDIYAPERKMDNTTVTYHGDDGYPIDREDWGLTFTTKDVTSTGMTLVIEQAGGQQVGELEISGFSLFSMDDNHAVSADQEKRQAFRDATKTVITQNGATEIQLDWTEVYGELPAGEYFMMPNVEDIYDESQIHPLIVKYKNTQSYRITFTIQ